MLIKMGARDTSQAVSSVPGIVEDNARRHIPFGRSIFFLDPISRHPTGNNMT